VHLDPVHPDGGAHDDRDGLPVGDDPVVVLHGGGGGGVTLSLPSYLKNIKR
jgi:hypothetical protein